MDTARRFRNIDRRDPAGSLYPERRLPAVQARAPALAAVGRAGVPACVSPKPKLLDQIRDALRTRHYSYRTEEAYAG
jgi:hypothetical protein